MNGADLRNEGMALVDRNTPQIWKDQAYTIIHAMRTSGVVFNAEDVRLFLPDPPRQNAMGSVFNHAVKKKWIKCIGYIKATRPSAHKRVLAQYKGLKP